MRLGTSAKIMRGLKSRDGYILTRSIGVLVLFFLKKLRFSEGFTKIAIEAGIEHHSYGPLLAGTRL